MATTPEPPYVAVIFTNQRTAGDDPEYDATAVRMEQLAARIPGFLGVESARAADGTGITVSYWKSLEAIARWREHAEHLVAQQHVRERWYARYRLRVCRVERAHGFDGQLPGA